MCPHSAWKIPPTLKGSHSRLYRFSFVKTFLNYGVSVLIEELVITSVIISII